MRCVEMVAGQNRNKHLARMLHKVAEDIGAGYSMAQSFETNIPGLPKTFVETVRAASSPARWKRASSVSTSITTNPPRPGPRSSAP